MGASVSFKGPKKSESEFKLESSSTKRRKGEKTPKQKRKNKSPTKQAEGLLLDDVLAADKEVAELYLNRYKL